MKKMIFAIIALSALFAACDPTKEELPTVSFETAIPMTVDGASVLSIMVSDYSGNDELIVPVTFGGSAEKDVDYTLSAESFVIGGASPVTSIKVTPVNYGSDKTITATLEIPENFAAGKYTTTSFTLSKAIGYATFSSNSGIMTSTIAIGVNIMDGNGKALTLQDGDKIEVSVNTEESTAIEGTHFKFKDNNKFAVIEPSQSSGTVELEFMELAEGQDKIVLDLKLTSKYSLGQFDKTTVSILGSYFDMLDGKWVMNSHVTDQTHWDATWSSMCTGYEFMPQLNTNDYIEINLNEGKFIPHFESSYKDYYIGDSNLTKDKEISYMSGVGIKPTTVQLFILDNINRFFSPTEQSDDKVGYVGARIIDDETSGGKLLELHTLDHTSHAFMTELIDYEMYSKTKPTCVNPASYVNPLIATFKKVE